MPYELILQFALAPRDVARFDRVTRFEERLGRGGELYSLGGSDCKLGCIEVRLLTEDPPRALEAVRDLIPADCPYDAVQRPVDAGWTDELLPS
ncbi:MAG: hypothetical protein JO277_13410 [Candidatus Eremiobacteraeota bacterium]|nr:hypothetical protein [Candidatus Eremiobacteraeota bacterium]